MDVWGIGWLWLSLVPRGCCCSGKLGTGPLWGGLALRGRRVKVNPGAALPEGMTAPMTRGGQEAAWGHWETSPLDGVGDYSGMDWDSHGY